ncbi:MAG: AMP-binding protein, partial [Caenispirillum sp.]|nr:AMP-binding protein [Caenispirillum sp.]
MTTLPTLLNGALVTPEGRVSAAELDLLSRRAAAALAAAGVGPGDAVGLWLPNGPMWVALLFACARRGAIAVSLNTRYRAAEVGDILRRSGCKVLA